MLSFGKNESISGRWKIEKGNFSAVFAEKLKAGVHTCSFNYGNTISTHQNIFKLTVYSFEFQKILQSLKCWFAIVQ